MAGAPDHGANHLGVDVLGGGRDATVIITIVAGEAKSWCLTPPPSILDLRRGLNHPLCGTSVEFRNAVRAAGSPAPFPK